MRSPTILLSNNDMGKDQTLIFQSQRHRLESNFGTSTLRLGGPPESL